MSSPVFRRGYTIIEMVVATALTLLVMAAVVTLFGAVSQSVSRGQAMMETVDRVRSVQHRLQLDLKYHTARMVPPLDPADGLGYFEIVEGPGPSFHIDRSTTPPTLRRPLAPTPINSEASNALDTSVGDVDDILMFTARSYGEPFLGRWGGNTIQSRVAEIAYFVRGNTLYRRVLLVLPQQAIPTGWYGNLYGNADISVRQEGGSTEAKAGWGNGRLVANSLGDLTKRENRYAHYPSVRGNVQPLGGWPHDVRMWGQLGLPTLRECSHGNWPLPWRNNNAPNILPPNYPAPANQIDYWLNPHPWSGVDADTGTLSAYRGNRVAEDVVLTNVISFDVKVYDPLAPCFVVNNEILKPGDPGYRTALDSWFRANMPANRVVSRGAYVDLYYARGIIAANQPISPFSFAGLPGSGLQASASGAAVYDTYSTHYENDGINQDGDPLVDEGTDGLDNDNRLGVDDGGPAIPANLNDIGERETIPPYPTALRGIQIKIRVYEPDSRQIREVTVTQDFLK